MARYILQRLLLMVPTLLGVVTVVFFSLHLVPGDPVDLMIPPDLGGAAREAMAAQIRAQYGLDKPLWEQYVTYLERLLHGDFGRSLRNGTLISQDLMRRVPNTLQLGLLAFVISTALGLLVGVVAATHKDRVWDRLSMVVALLGVSLPNFWLGFMLMLLFGLYWKVLPPTGFGGSIFTWEGLRYAILPALTLAASTTGVVARFTRSSMLEVIRQDYVRTARAKGLPERRVIYRHALKNALIPVVTVLGIEFGSLLSGAVIVETVFAWPGVGRYLVGGITARDFPVVQAGVVVVALGFVVANFLTDMLYAYIQPRIRYD